MLNHEMMTMTLSRHEMCDIRLALTSVLCDLRDELNDPQTTESRKAVVERSIEKWDSLRDRFIRQFNELDV